MRLLISLLVITIVLVVATATLHPATIYTADQRVNFYNSVEFLKKQRTEGEDDVSRAAQIRAAKEQLLTEFNKQLQKDAESEKDPMMILMKHVLNGKSALEIVTMERAKNDSDNIFRKMCKHIVKWQSQEITEMCQVNIKAGVCTLADYVEGTWANRSDVNQQLPKHNEFRTPYPWTLDALDSFGGLMNDHRFISYGNMISVGAYDECKQIDFRDGANENTMQKYLDPIIVFDNENYTTPAINFDNEYPNSLENYFMIGTSVFVTFIAVWVITGTTIDYVDTQAKRADPHHKPQRKWAAQIALCFSLYSNGRKLLSTEKRAGSVDCIQGIRFISMAWVLLGHTYAFTLSSAINTTDFFHIVPQWLFQIINNATVSVDTFFWMSGFLVCYLYLRQVSTPKGRKQASNPFFWIMFYVHRYLRLTPVLGVGMAVIYAYWPYTGSGPFWYLQSNPDTSAVGKACQEHWWYNILYINNFLDGDQQCIGWVWYLANDMQFYILSPIALLFLTFIPALGIVVLVMGLSGSIMYNFLMTWVNDWPPGQLSTVNIAEIIKGGDPDFFNQIYQWPFGRIGVYLVGMIMAYILHVYERKYKNRKFNKYVVVLLWAFAIGLQWAVLFGPFHWVKTGQLYSGKIGNAFYAALHRPVWGLSVGMVVLLCYTGNGGFINGLLSWPALWPLSRLTYCAYLLHPVVLFHIGSCLRAPFYFSHYQIVFYYLHALVLTYFLAFCLSMMFEAPFMQLEKLLFQFRSHAHDNKHDRRHSTKVAPKPQLDTGEDHLVEEAVVEQG